MSPIIIIVFFRALLDALDVHEGGHCCIRRWKEYRFFWIPAFGLASQDMGQSTRIDRIPCKLSLVHVPV